MKRLMRFSCVVMCAALLLSLVPQSAAGDKELSKLKKQLIRAINAKDDDKIGDALVEIVAHGGAGAVKLIMRLIERVPSGQTVVYWRLVRGVCAVTDREAMVELAAAIVKHRRDSLGRDLLFALQNNRCRNVAIVHEAVLERCPYDMQKMAIESLVNMEDEAAVDALIAGLDKVTDRSVRAEIIDGLRMLTRADCGDTAEDWVKWWEVSREQGLGLSKKGKAGDPSKGFTGTVVDELERYRRDQLFGGEGGIKLKALVISDFCDPGKPWKGAGGAICFDHIEEVLRRMKVEVKVVMRKEFSKPGYKIPDDVLGIFVNCVQIHPHCICPDCTPGNQKKDRLFP